MQSEFSAVVERDGPWYIARCLEVPGANGQGKTKAAALRNLSESIALVLEDRRLDAQADLPESATQETVVVRT